MACSGEWISQRHGAIRLDTAATGWEETEVERVSEGKCRDLLNIKLVQVTVRACVRTTEEQPCVL